MRSIKHVTITTLLFLCCQYLIHQNNLSAQDLSKMQYANTLSNTPAPGVAQQVNTTKFLSIITQEFQAYQYLFIPLKQEALKSPFICLTTQVDSKLKNMKLNGDWAGRLTVMEY